MRSLALGSLFLFTSLVPFENMLLVEGIGTLARFTGSLAFLFGVAAVLETRRVQVEATHIWATLFVASAAASLLWTIEPERTLARAATYTQLLAAIWLIAQLVKEERDVRLLLAAYVLGAWVAIGGTFYSFSRGIEVFFGRFAAAGFDPNDLAYILAAGIPLAWYLRSEAERPSRWMYSTYPIAAVGAILLTASRGGVFAAAAGLVFIAATTRPLRLVAGIVCIALAVVAFGHLLPLPYEGIARLSTIGNELVAGTMNQRTVIWAAGLAVAIEVPVLGVGAGAFPTAVLPNLASELAPHNALLSILVEQGALGLAALVAVIGAMSRRLLGMPGPERRLWIAVVSVLAVALTLANWEWRKQTWLLLGLAVAHASVLEAKPASSDRPRSADGLPREFEVR